MTYQEYSTQLKVSGYLGKPLTGRYKKIHDHLTGIWDGLEIVVDSGRNWTILHKEEVWFMAQDNKNGIMWCKTDRVWSFFEKDMGMELTDTEGFIKTAVEEHLKCEVGTPTIALKPLSNRWKNISNVRLEHLTDSVSSTPPR